MSLPIEIGSEDTGKKVGLVAWSLAGAEMNLLCRAGPTQFISNFNLMFLNSIGNF
jgi:hypothetical protein